jgi:hypothetical protein
MAPGRISFTPTPDPARSIASASLHPASANFEPEYAASVAMPNRPPTLETLTNVPERRDSMRGSRAKVMATGEK